MSANITGVNKMRCQNCGQTNPATAKFCSCCDSQLIITELDICLLTVLEESELAPYIKSCTIPETATGSDLKPKLEDNEVQPAGHNTDPSIGVFQKIRFVIDIIGLTFPLWCPGNAIVTRKEGSVEVFYIPPGNYQKNIDVFVRRVIWYGARAIKRFARHSGVNRINIWASGRIVSEEDVRRRIWKGVNFTVNIDDPGSLNKILGLAKTKPEEFLLLTSAKWVDQKKFPEWPWVGTADYSGM
jgi:hypothetical protein